MGISSCRLHPSSTVSRIDESLRMEFSISSAAWVSMSVAPIRSSLKGLGVVEVLPPVPPVTDVDLYTSLSSRVHSIRVPTRLGDTATTTPRAETRLYVGRIFNRQDERLQIDARISRDLNRPSSL